MSKREQVKEIEENAILLPEEFDNAILGTANQQGGR